MKNSILEHEVVEESQTIEGGQNEAELLRLAGEAAADETQPETAEQQAQTADANQQAYVMAGTICALLAKGASFRYPYLSFPNETIKQGADVLAPVLVKYDLQSEFLDKWKEEISAGVFFATVIFQSYKTVKEHEAIEKQQAKAKVDSEVEEVN